MNIADKLEVWLSQEIATLKKRTSTALRNGEIDKATEIRTRTIACMDVQTILLDLQIEELKGGN